MKKIGFALAWFCVASASAFAVACSTSSDSSSAAGACNILGAGTYVVHSTRPATDPDGGLACPPPDLTLSIPSNAQPIADEDASADDPCSYHTDKATCTLTTVCKVLVGGHQVLTTTTITPSADGNSATGTNNVVTSQPDGGIVSTCNDITTTFTKQ
ncbi:MAG: hypothetical protein ABI461_20495 [Polyangiaceae bacterium]